MLRLHSKQKRSRHSLRFEKLIEYLASFNLLFVSRGELDSVLAYENDTITSRVLTKNKEGFVELYAFAEDQKLYQSSVKTDSLLQVVEGEITLVIGGEIRCIAAGELFTIPADTCYIINNKKRSRLILISSYC